MDRRTFLSVSVLSAAAVTAADPAFGAQASGTSFGFAADGSAFLLNGQPFQIRSGEMHPARIPVQHWRHRIQMAKAMGLNTVSIYVMWNSIEEAPGVFDFTTDRRDIAAFIGLCQQEGMWVLLRGGPYVCGAWDLGGIPPYLLANPGIQLRVNSATDPHYMAAVNRYIAHLAPVVKPLMATAGGPILMVQIENEYGSFGSDGTYLEEIRQAWIANGISGPFYTEDGLSQVEANKTNVAGGAIALSGGDASQIASARQAFPAVPAMPGEVYPGWLTHNCPDPAAPMRASGSGSRASSSASQGPATSATHARTAALGSCARISTTSAGMLWRYPRRSPTVCRTSWSGSRASLIRSSRPVSRRHATLRRTSGWGSSASAARVWGGQESMKGTLARTRWSGEAAKPVIASGGKPAEKTSRSSRSGSPVSVATVHRAAATSGYSSLNDES